MNADDDVLEFPGTLIERLGIEILSVTPDTVIATMPVAGNTQPYGLLHGGASASLAETVGSLGAMAHAAPDAIAVGVDLNITHHRGVTEGTVTATASALYKGRSVATYSVTIKDNQDRLVATARLTCALKTRS